MADMIKYSIITEKAGRYLKPPVDIFDTGTEIRMFIDMPGVDKESVSVTLRSDRLFVKGVLSEWEEGRRLVRHCPCIDYFRSFILSEEIRMEQIEASMSNGVLVLTIHKERPSGDLRIKVEG